MLDGSLSPDGPVVVALTVLVVLAAGLLVPAGIAKLRDPAVAREALGLPGRAAPLVRLIGAGELALAAAVLATGARPAVVAIALTYAGFTLVATRQRSRGASCGCFGATETPTGWHHVLVDAAIALAAGAAALVGTPAPATLLADAPMAGVPLGVGVLVATASLQLVITALPELADARRTAAGGAP